MTLTTGGLSRPYGYGREYPTLNPTLTPAAGNPSVLTVPGSRNFRISSVSATLTTSAVAGNRTPAFELLDGDGNVWLHLPSSATVAASTTTKLAWAAGMPSAYTGGDGALIAPIPDLILPVGMKAQVTWAAVGAGDALSAVAWFYDELIIGQGGYTTGLTEALPPLVDL